MKQMRNLLGIFGCVGCVVFPAWSETAIPGCNLADAVTVSRASQPSLKAPPGASINVGANFIVRCQVHAEYTLVLRLVDGQGRVVGDVKNNLNWNFTGLPTTQWAGPVTIVTPVVVPSVPDGVYEVQLSLDDMAGRAVQLTSEPDVGQRHDFHYAIGTVLVHAGAPPPSPIAPAPLDLSGYKLTFNDDFKSMDISDSVTNDGSKWYTGVVQCCMSTTDNAATAMVGVHDPDNPFSIVSGQGLRIRLQKKTNKWTSGVITTVDASGQGFSQQYGYFEMKAKFPSGINTWPAFWLLNTISKSHREDAGEIDIVEYVANPDFNNVIRTTLHDWSKPRNVLPWSANVVTVPSDGHFHTYAMLWTKDTMTFYYDESVTFRTPTPKMMQQPYFLVLDLGIGSGYPTDNTPSPNDMIVRYVRAYTLPGQ